MLRAEEQATRTPAVRLLLPHHMFVLDCGRRGTANFGSSAPRPRLDREGPPTPKGVAVINTT
jgi:hypothetical protein